MKKKVEEVEKEEKVEKAELDNPETVDEDEEEGFDYFEIFGEEEEIDEDAIDTEIPADMFVVEKKPVYSFFKRVIDILVSLPVVIILFIPSAIFSLVIYLDSPGASPIFVQKRVGKLGKKFKFYKFRTMIPDAEKKKKALEAQNEMKNNKAFKMKNDPRLTRIGKKIRKYSIDELPQFLNVLKGDMSIVGPRPPLVKEVMNYTDEHKIRLAIKPGLTCYWQVQHERNKIDFDKWVELDSDYIKERSFKTDLKIFFKTFKAIFGAEGM